jgi:hypothetical protein
LRDDHGEIPTQIVVLHAGWRLFSNAPSLWVFLMRRLLTVALFARAFAGGVSFVAVEPSTPAPASGAINDCRRAPLAPL